MDQDDAVDEQVESLHKHLLGVAPVRSRTAEERKKERNLFSELCMKLI